MKSNLVKCFSNSVLGVNLTTILIDMEPWFIAKEVATLLGYEKTKEAVNRHVDELDQKILSYNECKELFGQNIISDETLENAEDFGELSDSSPNNSIKINNNGMKFINESGLYTLIARSNKQEARKFQRWVTSEVLPSIRKTGSYNVQKQDPSYMIEDPIERAKAWIREQEEKRALEAEKKALEEKNKDLQSTNDELVTEVEILLNSYVNTKQVYEMYLQNYPEAPNQAKSTMMGKIRKALCNICNERKTGRKIYKKHILNQKNEIEWRQEYFFDQDTKQILFDRVEDDLNYIVNIKLR